MDDEGRAGRRLSLGSLSAMFGPVGIATLARGAFGLALATALIARYESSVAVEFFQLLFLQSIFITLASGAGYVHAVHAAEAVDGGRRLLGAYVQSGLAIVALVYVLLWASPPALTGEYVTSDPWKIHVLLAGGLCAGLNGVLQGLLLKSVGPWRVFMPSVVAAVLSAVALIVPDAPSGAILVIWVGSQATGLFFLAFANLDATRRLLAREPMAFNDRESSPGTFGALAAAGFGAVNTVSLLIVYGFREVWSHGAAAETAEAGFFALRLSDTYLQVLVLGLVQTGALQALRAPSSRRVDLGALLILVGVSTLSLGLIGGWLFVAAGLPVLGLAIVAQLICDLVRIPSSVTSMAELQRGRVWRYALVVLPGPLLAAGLVLSGPTGGLWSLYLFQVAMTGLQVAGFLALRALDARTTSPLSEVERQGPER